MFRQPDSRLLREEATVFLVGCDPAASQQLRAAIRQADLRIEAYGSPQDFLDACSPHRPGCLVLDLRASGSDHRELFDQLAQRQLCLPVILLVLRGEFLAAVGALRAGAFNVLVKPFTPQQIAEAVREALDWDAQHRPEILERLRIQRRLARLNRAEQEVLELLVSGLSNRGIAAQLGLSVRAVETRRSHLMRKMRAKSLAELLRQAFAVRYADRRFGPAPMHS